VLPEAESAALLAAVRREVDLATSVVGRIETFRAVLRASGNAELVPRIEETFRAVTVIDVTPRIRRWAETRPPFHVRTLDAIHLGTALSLGESLEAFVVYDTAPGGGHVGSGAVDASALVKLAAVARLAGHPHAGERSAHRSPRVTGATLRR
jgi:predicted nucleic acid-binding protein